MTQPILESALRRAAFWARRGMPHTAAELLAGTDGLLRFRPEHNDLVAKNKHAQQSRREPFLLGAPTTKHRRNVDPPQRLGTKD